MQTEIKIFNGNVVRVPAYIYQEHIIWGATAIMLSEFTFIIEKIKPYLQPGEPGIFGALGTVDKRQLESYSDTDPSYNICLDIFNKVFIYMEKIVSDIYHVTNLRHENTAGASKIFYGNYYICVISYYMHHLIFEGIAQYEYLKTKIPDLKIVFVCVPFKFVECKQRFHCKEKQSIKSDLIDCRSECRMGSFLFSNRTGH